MTARVWISLCLAACALAAKKPVTHEALWLMKRAGAPVVSPDGRHVLYAVTEPAYDDKEQASDLWLAAADGSTAPRRLTATKAAEGGAAWSPDSRRIAFTARREGDEAAQVYVLDLAGGEAQRVTTISSGASGPKWSPDGRALLFTSAVYPQARDDDEQKKIAAERKARKYRARAYDGFPIRYWDHWLDDMKPAVFVVKLEPGASPRNVLAGTKLMASAGFGGLFGLSSEELQPVWTPDGQSIVFTATRNRNEAAFAQVRTDLFVIPAWTSGEPRALTSGPDSYASPQFRPDGQALYCLHSREGKQVYSLNRLAVLAWPNPAAPRILTEGFDRSVDGFVFTGDSQRVYFTADEHGFGKLFTLPAGGGTVTSPYDLKRGNYAGLSAGGATLAALYDSAVSPGEVVRIDAAAGKHTPLTSLNTAAAADLDWQLLREFWFTSSKGRRVHSFVVVPQNFDESKKYPLFVLIHGGPHSMWKDQFFLRWNYHLIASPGYVVLLTDYTGSTGYGEKFANLIQGDPLKTPGEEINEAADEAIKRYSFVDGSRQAAGGASYGGHLANWLQATTTRYKCLVSHAGLINLESQWGTSDTIWHREVNNGGPVWEQGPVWREQNPIRFAAKFRTPILITVGENDYRVPLNQTLENWSVLQRLKIPSRLVVFPDANHWIQKGEDSRYFYQELHGWLKRWLNP
ncbi:MAG: S9 family peptidase [Bryobacter sp.]|nr:S9 family peptidase [Bryobacter sp.]